MPFHRLSAPADTALCVCVSCHTGHTSERVLYTFLADDGGAGVQHPSVLGRERPTSTSAADSSLGKGHLLSLQLYVHAGGPSTASAVSVPPSQVLEGAKGVGYVPEVELW
jgi:hypothetical protein